MTPEVIKLAKTILNAFSSKSGSVLPDMEICDFSEQFEAAVRALIIKREDEIKEANAPTCCHCGKKKALVIHSTLGDFCSRKCETAAWDSDFSCRH